MVGKSGPNKELFTIFIDNLPKAMNSIWLRKMFQKLGEVVDAYVSFKARAKKDSPFGFVRFNQRTEAYNAINSHNGVGLLDKRLIVKKADYHKGGSKTQGRNNSDQNRQMQKTEEGYSQARLGALKDESVQHSQVKAPIIRKLDRKKENWWRWGAQIQSGWIIV